MAKLVHNTLSAFESFDDRPALFDDGVEFTYRELLAEINRFAHALTRHGLRRGDGLSVRTGNRWELLAVKFAAQVLGLRFVAMDPNHVVGGLSFLVRDIDAALILIWTRSCPLRTRPSPLPCGRGTPTSPSSSTPVARPASRRR